MVEAPFAVRVTVWLLSAAFFRINSKDVPTLQFGIAATISAGVGSVQATTSAPCSLINPESMSAAEYVTVVPDVFPVSVTTGKESIP